MDYGLNALEEADDLDIYDLRMKWFLCTRMNSCRRPQHHHRENHDENAWQSGDDDTPWNDNNKYIYDCIHIYLLKHSLVSNDIDTDLYIHIYICVRVDENTQTARVTAAHPWRVVVHDAAKMSHGLCAKDAP